MADIFKKLNHFASGKSVLAGIVAANAIVFLLIWTSMLVSRSLGYGNMANWLILPPSFEETILQPWSIATYMFTHIRLLHLVANMAWLYCFGIIFLDLYPNRALMRTYIAGGLAGAILYLAAGAVHPLNGLAGASAAVLAIAAATVVRAPNYGIRLFVFGIVKIKWVAAAFVLFALLTTDIHAIGSHAAHIGGIAAGCAIALNARYGIFRRSESVRKPAVDIEHRLDELLDKVKTSGYNSLSAREKKELSDLSGKIEL